MYVLRRLRTPTACVLLSLTITTATVARDCANLFAGLPSPKITELADGQLLQLSGGAWKVVPVGATLGLPGQELQLAYVVLDIPGEFRRGVLLFKTARQRLPAEPTSPRDVQLSRTSRHVDNFPCGNVKAFRARSVPADSYDTYHDEGRKVVEHSDLDEFHFQYAARRNGCRLTNDQNPDNWYDPRTNRGQYSFNKDVVGYQTFSQILAMLGVSGASASSASLRDQQVDAKQYRTLANTPACVRFKTRVPGPASFLRINDLEGQSQSGNRLFRSSEQEWILSP